MAEAAAPAAPEVAASPANGSSDRKYEFEDKMSCGGCSGAVSKVLSKLDGSCPVYSRFVLSFCLFRLFYFFVCFVSRSVCGTG